jgi:predicted nucleic acid-binding protein
MLRKQVVIDSSAILAYIFPNEELPKEIQNVFNRYEKNEIDFYAPDLLKLEVANALRSSFLSKRATKEELLQYFREFQEIPLYYENPDIEESLENSLKHKLSIYDSLFFTLAEKKKIQLISLDKHLKYTH